MTTAAGPWWRLKGNGQPEGPFDAAEMREALRTGRLHSSDPIWSPDASDWTRFDVLFPIEPGREPRPPLVGLAIAALVYAAAATAVVVLLFDSSSPWDAPETPSLPIVRAIWIAVAVVMAFSTFAVSRLARRAAAMMRGRPRARGFLRGASVGLAIAGGALTGLQGIAASVVPENIVELGAYRYSVTRETNPDRVVVSGDVGTGFGKAVIEAVQGLPDPVRIEITSGGGLLREAMQAARVIEMRPGATVVARRDCDSACTVVLMAGSQRLADNDMKIGFHAASIVDAASKRSTLFGFNLSLFLARFAGDDFLERRGVPADIIDEANRIGHEDMYEVDAQTLLKRGVLTGLVDPLPSPRIPDDDDEESMRE